MNEGLGIVEAQGLIFSLVASGRQVVSLTTTEQDSLVELDAILAKEQDQRPAPFAICRTTNHIGSAIRQVACTLFGTGIRNIGYLWLAPCFTSVVANGCQFTEGTLLVTIQHDDGAVWLYVLTRFYLARLFACIL